MTPPFPISALCEDAAIQQMADATFGLNAAMQLLLTNYPSLYDLTAVPSIDFTNENQVQRAWVDPNDYYNSGNPEDIALFVHCNGTADQKNTKFYDFSGAVAVVVDFFLTDPEEGIPCHLQPRVNLINDAIYKVFGADRFGPLQAAGVLLNGGIQCVRTRPVLADRNWFQALSCTMPFRVN
jgi:hypothetical protein